MVSGDGRYTIVFNGEIYNYRELRRRLEARVAFRSESDTEVLLEGLGVEGLGFLQSVRGMFALAVWDEADAVLTVARDRTGIKPLYVLERDGYVAFGSEPKALADVQGGSHIVRERALIEVLCLGYPVGPRTALRDVREVAAGSWERFALRGRGVERTQGRYWSWQRRAEPWSMDESLRQAEIALTASMREHLVADVPVGAFLSGGIDSTVAVTLLSRERPELQTFTVKFSEPRFDESAAAAATARALGVRHEIIELPAAGGTVEQVEAVIDQFDLPFADSSAIPSYLLCQAVSKHVKVAIGADGGDEVFGGYTRFAYADTARLLGPLASWLPFERLARLRLGDGTVERRWKRAMRMLDPTRRFDALCSYLPMDDLRASLTTHARSVLGPYLEEVLLPSSPPAGAAEFIDATIQRTLPSDYLRKVDVTSSAHGLEVRVPFLGNQVLDWSERVPTSQQVGPRRRKHLLRLLAARLGVAEETLNRRKQGFGIPLGAWLGSPGRQHVAQFLSRPNAAIGRWFSQQHLHSVLHGWVQGSHTKGKLSAEGMTQHIYALWTIERWLMRQAPGLV